MDKCKQNETFSKQNCSITDTADYTSSPHVLLHSKNTINRLYDPVRYTKTSIHTLHSITMKQSVHFTAFLLGGELVGGESTSWWRDDRLATSREEESFVHASAVVIRREKNTCLRTARSSSLTISLTSNVLLCCLGFVQMGEANASRRITKGNKS